jgi:FMN phosphatase YigB (HAD superfamily)
MVGDSLKHDVEGARNAGWRAVLLRRSGETPANLPADLPVITTLDDVFDHL